MPISNPYRQQSTERYFEFINSDLTDSQIIFTHGLKRLLVDVSLFNDVNDEIQPSGVVTVDHDNVSVSLEGLTPITGVWKALIEI